MDGTDDADNLATLTAREHYVAHQLLVKLHPDNYSLANAANMMSTSSTNQVRNNRSYAWLRERYAKAKSEQQKGSGNTNYGKRWYVNYVTGDVICTRDDIPSGTWMAGKTYANCVECNVGVKPHCQYCDSCRSKHQGRGRGTWVVDYVEYATIPDACEATQLNRSTILQLCLHAPDTIRTRSSKQVPKGKTPRQCGYYKIV